MSKSIENEVDSEPKVSIDLSILQESSQQVSIWIPNSLSGDEARMDTHLTGASSINQVSSNNQDFSLRELELETDLKDSVQLVLRSIFSNFINKAQLKINSVKAFDLRSEFRLTKELAKGCDEEFDEVLSSLGSIGRHCPEFAINSILTWRGMHTKDQESMNFNRRQSRSVALLTDRITLSVSYITCRAFIEILQQIKLSRSIESAGRQLEEFTFSFLKKFTPQLIAKSVNHQDIYILLGELTTSLSNLRFSSLSDRFIAELEQVPDDPNEPLINEELIILMIHSLKYLKLKIYPADALEETAEFLLSCATFLRKTLFTRLKHAYAEAFIEILLPIAPVVVAEVNFPIWVKAIDLLYQKASKMLTKPRYYYLAFPFMTAVLGVSPKEVFQSKWPAFFENCVLRLKDKNSKHTAIGCMSRLVWVYLYRCPDPAASTHKRLDLIYRQVFSQYRRQLFTNDLPLDHFSKLIYFAASYDLDYTLSNWLTNFLSLDAINLTGNGANNIDFIVPERFTITIRAFLLILNDIFKSIRVPTFPVAVDFNLFNPTQKLELETTPQIPRVYSEEMELMVSNRLQSFLRLLIELLDKLLPHLEMNHGSLLVVNENYVSARGSFQSAIQNSLANHFATPGSIKENPNDQLRHPYPKITSLSIFFNRDKQPFFDLISAWLDLIPVVLPTCFSIPRLIEWIGKLTLHIDHKVSKSASTALLRMACQMHLYVPILRGLYKLILDIDPQYSEVLASSNCNTALELPTDGLELLKVFEVILSSWKDFLLSMSMDKVDKEDHDRSLNLNFIQETEAFGLLFLCSTFPSIRTTSLSILSLVADISKHYKKVHFNPEETVGDVGKKKSESSYVYDNLMTPKAEAIFKDVFHSAKLPFKIPDGTITLSELNVFRCATGREATLQKLWEYCFPRLCKFIHEHCPAPTILCRHLASFRLKKFYDNICNLSEVPDPLVIASTSDFDHGIHSDKYVLNAGNLLLEQWGRYLVFVCSTITLLLESTPTPSSIKRKDSKPSDKVTSAKELFRLVLVLLSCENRRIRSLVVSSLCHINHGIYGAFIEDIQPFLRIVQEDTRSRIVHKNFKNKHQQDRFREGITECLSKTASMLQDGQYVENHALTHLVVSHIQDVYQFLSQPEVQNDWTLQELRIFFCDLVRKIYHKLTLLPDSHRFLSFELRHAIFTLAEKWCGHGQHQSATRDLEALMMREVLEQYKDVIQQGTKTLMMENIRKRLELASLNLMSSLCKGPVISPTSQISNGTELTNSSSPLMFDLPGLFRWIESILQSPDKRIHQTARDALKGLLASNTVNPLLFENVLYHCYNGDPHQNSTQAYFLALGETISGSGSFPFSVGKKVLLIAFKIGDPKLEIRRMACKLLRIFWKSSSEPLTVEQNYILEKSVHPLSSIYEKARIDVSAFMAKSRPDLVLEVFSETIMRLSNIHEPSVRQTLLMMVPWTTNLALSSENDQRPGLSTISSGVVINLIYLVVKFSDLYPTEIAKLWQTLFNNETNFVALESTLDFLIQLCLEKRNPSLIFYIKNIFVYISHTKAGFRMIQYLMERLTPTSMVPQKKSEVLNRFDRFKHISTNLYVVNLDDFILTHAKRPALSPGQLILIFLSDVILAAKPFSQHLPLLIHLGACQAFDSGLLPNISKELSQPILPNILLSLIERKGNVEEGLVEVHRMLSKYIDSRLLDPIFVDTTVASGSITSQPEPTPLETLVNDLIAFSSTNDKDLMTRWCEVAIQWATACPIRSVAKASFTIYRKFSTPLQPSALVDILTQLASTFSDLSSDIQTFVQEILLSLSTRLESVQLSNWSYTPSLFWFLIGCLYGYNESEYYRCLLLLEKVVDQIATTNLQKVTHFLSYLPDQLYLPTLEDVLIMGLSSSKAFHHSFQLLQRFLDLPLRDLIVDSNKASMALLLVSFPVLIDLATITDPTYTRVKLSEEYSKGIDVEDLIKCAEACGCVGLASFLTTLPQQKFRSEEICLRQLLTKLKETFFPAYEAEALLLALGTLFPDEPRLVRRRLKLVKLLISAVNPTHLQFNTQHYAHLKPLIQLLEDQHYDDALEVLEDIMTSSHGFTTNTLHLQNKLGLWKQVAVEPNSGVEELNGEVKLGEKMYLDQRATWSVSTSELRQETTRQLLNTIASATHSLRSNSTPNAPERASLQPKEMISSSYQNKLKIHIPTPTLALTSDAPADSVESTHTFATQFIQIVPPTPISVSSPYQPPEMTDFYVEGNRNGYPPSFQERMQHRRNLSSLSDLKNKSVVFQRHRKQFSSQTEFMNFNSAGLTSQDALELKTLFQELERLEVQLME